MYFLRHFHFDGQEISRQGNHQCEALIDDIRGINRIYATTHFRVLKSVALIAMYLPDSKIISIGDEQSVPKQADALYLSQQPILVREANKHFGPGYEAYMFRVGKLLRLEERNNA